MLKKIKSHFIHHTMVYLNSHLKIKSFMKKCVHSHRFVEKTVYKMIDTSHQNEKNGQKNLVCSKRAKRVYMELKKGLD